MASLVIPTLASLTAEVEDLRARADRLASGLTRSQFNWQPDDGRKWSVGQCFDHLARANTLYLEAVTRAIDAAPPYGAERTGRIVRPTPASTHSIAITSRIVMVSPRRTTAAAAVTTGTSSWTTAALQAASAGSAVYHRA